MKNSPLAIPFVLLPVLFGAARLFAEEPAPPVWRVLDAGSLPNDSRLDELRSTRDTYHPWTPATSWDAWQKQSRELRERVLVSSGLWPLPPQPPIQPVIHGKIDRGDYTIEKVFFASHPGHYVTGNLYRPAGVSGTKSRVPGVLCPHGHWPNGRFYDAGVEQAKAQVDQGAEKYLSGARYPVQARMVQLARMGCVVFHYDMVGYADSRQIKHAGGFNDAEAGLRLQNFLGLQTFNSIRALDFLLSLPEVDPERIGVTGSSGGGTQTFMLGAVDPRPAVAFPAVMVSTNMQGGCICENAAYLRINANNVAFAALFAPKPLALSGANDWTIDIESKGLPELKQVYALYDKPQHVAATAFPQFGHNYNGVAREMMYNWFNTHLQLGLESPVVEQDFVPVSPEELSVFDDEHPLPGDAVSSAELRDYLTNVAQSQFESLLPESAEQLAEYRRVVGTAARVLLDADIPERSFLESSVSTIEFDGDLRLMKGMVRRKQTGEEMPFVALIPADFRGTAVIWIDGNGKAHLFDNEGQPSSVVRRLLGAGNAVVSADVFLTGEFLAPGNPPQYPKVDENYQGYTFGFNRPVLSNRVRDIVSLIAGVRYNPNVSRIKLVGIGEAGPWALLAAAMAGEHLDEAIVDLNGFRFEQEMPTGDPMYLPGALKYGGIGGLAALAAPTPLTLAGIQGLPAGELRPLSAAYRAAAGRLDLVDGPLDEKAVADRLQR